MEGDHCCHWTKGIPTTPLTAQQLLSRIADIEHEQVIQRSWAKLIDMAVAGLQKNALRAAIFDGVPGENAPPPLPAPTATTPDVCKGCERELTRRFERINKLERALSAAHMDLKETHAEVARLKHEVEELRTETARQNKLLTNMEVVVRDQPRRVGYFTGLDANGTPLYTTVEELLRELAQAKKDAEICPKCGERMVCKDRCERRTREECHPADHDWGPLINGYQSCRVCARIKDVP